MMNNMQDLVGKRIGRYEVQAHVGRGGVADVYLAYDVDLQRKVALKILLPALAHDAAFVQRFRREAQTVARLDHPNIVNVYDIGLTPQQRPYIAMQYIEGGSLRDRLAELAERGKLIPTEQALAIMRQMAEALSVAHQAGIVHRDLKPGNILVRTDGTPVLVDLGIAVVAGGARLTQTGNLIGTPHYMSPEQVRDQPLDGRSDLYSLGIILYELLAGVRPFDAEESIAILHKQVYEEPLPLEQLRDDLAPQTAMIVRACLQKDPGRRYQHAADLVGAIDQALAAEGSSARLAKTTVLLPGADVGELISRQQVVHVPPVMPPPGAIPPARPHPQPLAQPARGGPSWALVGAIGLIATLAVVIVLLLLRFASAGSNDGVTFSSGSPPLATPVQIELAIASNDPLPDEGAAPTEPPPPPTDAPPPTDPPPTETPDPPTPTPTVESSNLPLTIVGTDGLRMHLVPAGEFIMGSTSLEVDQAVTLCRRNPDGESCSRVDFINEMPQRTVYVSAFYMDETEITNAQYKACVNTGPCPVPASGSGRYRRGEYFDDVRFSDYPVVLVSWYDAKTYCEWIGERLPTEAEWEKAARGEDGRTFPWGNQFSTSRANTQDRGMERLEPVGNYQSGASPYGILDMAGGVWEYVEDWFDPDYYATSTNRDPKGPSSSPENTKVLRSGSYANYQHYARVSNRGAVPPGTATEFRGIRCVIDADEE